MSSLSKDSTFPTRLFPLNFWELEQCLYLSSMTSLQFQVSDHTSKSLPGWAGTWCHGAGEQQVHVCKNPLCPFPGWLESQAPPSPWIYWGLFTSSKYWFPIQSTRGLSSNPSLLIINLHIFRFSFETELDWVMSVRVRMSVYRLFLPAIDGDIRKVTTG